MRRFLLIIFLIAVARGVYAQDIQLVLNKMQEQQEAWNKGDLNTFMVHYWQSDSLKFVGKRGVTYGWQQTLNNYVKSYPNKEAMGLLKFSIISTEQLSDESIFVIGKWELSKDNPAGGHFTLLWKKIKNNWVIVCDHTS
jgi:ketosteroid isomerase-like protein